MLITYTVYILFNSERGKIYIGKTSNLVKRLLRHNNYLPHKKTSYTFKNSGKWIVVYKEEYSNNSDAIIREKWFKSGIGREFINNNFIKIIYSSTYIKD